MIDPIRNIISKEDLTYFIRGNPYESFDGPAKGIKLLKYWKEKRQYLYFEDKNENIPTVYIVEDYRKEGDKWLCAKIRQVSSRQSKRLRKRIEDLLIEIHCTK